MSDDRYGISKEYATGSETETKEVKAPELVPEPLLKVEDAKYGIAKPKRVTVRGKIAVDES